MYRAGTRIHLPFIEVTKEVGDKITDKELADAKQGDDEVLALRKGKSLLTEAEYEKFLKSQVDESRQGEIRALEARLAELKGDGNEA